MNRRMDRLTPASEAILYTVEFLDLVRVPCSIRDGQIVESLSDTLTRRTPAADVPGCSPLWLWKLSSEVPFGNSLRWNERSRSSVTRTCVGLLDRLLHVHVVSTKHLSRGECCHVFTTFTTTMIFVEISCSLASNFGCNGSYGLWVEAT